MAPQVTAADREGAPRRARDDDRARREHQRDQPDDEHVRAEPRRHVHVRHGEQEADADGAARVDGAEGPRRAAAAEQQPPEAEAGERRQRRDPPLVERVVGAEEVIGRLVVPGEGDDHGVQRELDDAEEDPPAEEAGEARLEEREAVAVAERVRRRPRGCAEDRLGHAGSSSHKGAAAAAGAARPCARRIPGCAFHCAPRAMGDRCTRETPYGIGLEWVVDHREGSGRRSPTMR